MGRHIVIQDCKHLPGGEPERCLLCRLNATRIAPYERIHEGDIVYLKASGKRRIDWKAVIDRFEYVEAEHVPLEQVREMTRGCRLYDDEKFWQEKVGVYRYGTVIWLRDDEMIVPPIITAGGQNRHSWIVIDSEEKAARWLGE